MSLLSKYGVNKYTLIIEYLSFSAISWGLLQYSLPIHASKNTETSLNDFDALLLWISNGKLAWGQKSL